MSCLSFKISLFLRVLFFFYILTSPINTKADYNMVYYNEQKKSCSEEYPAEQTITRSNVSPERKQSQVPLKRLELTSLNGMATSYLTLDKHIHSSLNALLLLSISLSISFHIMAALGFRDMKFQYTERQVPSPQASPRH